MSRRAGRPRGEVNLVAVIAPTEQDDAEPNRGERDVCTRGAERVVHANSRRDVEPAEHRVERPPDLQVERCVEDRPE